LPLVSRPFAETFDFARARPAPVRSAGGPASVGPNLARFDHTAEGAPRGLLIEGWPQYQAADRLSVKAGDWAVAGGTVLHQVEVAGMVQRRAWYSPGDPRPIANACLAGKGHHQLIAYVPQYLPDRGGFVTFQSRTFALAKILAAQPGFALAASADAIIKEG
jgi:hypothetical protein